jgi:hypothetical protein
MFKEFCGICPIKLNREQEDESCDADEKINK